MSILEAKGGDRAIAIEVDIFFKQWWKLVIWLYAEERSVDVLWNLHFVNMATFMVCHNGCSLPCQSFPARKYQPRDERVN
jgi:hypothetical protein